MLTVQLGFVVIIFLYVDYSFADWDRLKRERRMFERHQYAESTWGTRAAQIRAYFKFGETFSEFVEPYTCDSDQVCLVMVFFGKIMFFFY